MPVTVETQTLPDSLIIHVKQRFMHLWIVLGTLLLLAIGIGVTFLPPTAARTILTWIGRLGLVCWFGLTWRAQFNPGATNVRLTVTQQSIASDGFGPRGYSPSFLRREECELTYKSGLDEHDQRPSGLYAGRYCLLPGLNEEQTSQVMAAIRHRFPDTGTEQHKPAVEMQ